MEPPAEVYEMRVGQNCPAIFGLKVDTNTMVDPAPTGNGSAQDVASRIAMLTPEAREAYEWAIHNVKGPMRVMINDLYSVIKLEISEKHDATLFKMFWL